MADFYVKFGSKGAKLLGYFKLGSINIKLHQVGNRYIISRNRKILIEFYELDRAINGFYHAVMMEEPTLFNN